ncbi:hypothetical protein HF329_00135 [Chitinophaga oryzae]|uniref:DUF3300 domain-containing protein n=1 Tax=Chitinophaga oryzae TaxID=2725414 RepID=A0AAE6ZBT6_9BACT|nr:hypothetical protein [Chitinophaga oryzae]QJB29799.1 hypothetical protein HF329_00135 [Chitinophaga oryzae]
MKKLSFLALLIISALAFVRPLQAQVRLNVNVNIGNQPVWGPVGYDYAQYYYFPDIDVYYDIPRRQYVYLNGNSWLFAPALPARYHFDVYRGYKVVVNEPKPWLHPDVYRGRYARYKGPGWYGKQDIIRDSRDSKYYVVKGHPMYGKGNNGNGPGKGNDKGKHNDKGKFKDKGNKGHGKGHGHGHDK